MTFIHTSSDFGASLAGMKLSVKCTQPMKLFSDKFYDRKTTTNETDNETLT